MDIKQKYTFKDIPAQSVWDTIQDPDVLQKVLPGCQKFEEVGEEKYEAVLRINMGPIKGEFKADVEQVDKNEPESYRLLVKAKGKPGEINANARMNLEEADGDTSLFCEADVEASGLMASIGQRMVGGVAKTVMKKFFKDIEKEI